MSRPRRGFALIIVLWAMVLLTLLATQLTATGRTEARLASNLRGAAEAEADADGAVYRAIWRLLDQGIVTGTRQEPLGGGRTTVVVASEDGKVDLNTASVERLAALLRAVGVEGGRANQLAADLVLWRFPSAPTVERGRAYQQAGLGYRPPAAPFQSVAELGLVLGMTPDLMARLGPHVTIYHRGEPDPREADPVVRAILPAQAARPAGEVHRDGIVDIDVEVELAGGSRAARHAVVRIGATQANPAGWQILEWR